MKKVLIYGFTQNQAVFLTPAVNCILGECKIFAANDAVEISKSPKVFDIICINASMHFWELDFALTKLKEKVKGKIIGLSLGSVEQKNLDMLLHHGVKYTLINLMHEDEFISCRNALENNKAYYSKGSLALKNRTYESSADIYKRLSVRQKCAFHYMMSGKSLKEFRSDFNFNSLSTASSHWNMVLQKYQVHSVIQLRNKY